MKSLKSVLLIIFLMLIKTSHADVRLNGDLVVLDTIVGAKFLGEVINETDSPVKNVKITITSKDADGKIIDVSETYVDGYTNPEDGYSDDYIPVGGIVPFWTFADVDAEEISLTSHLINYENTDAVFDEPEQVTVLNDINPVESSYGVKYYGEIVNNSINTMYWVKILFAFKGKNGNLIDVDYTYIRGNDYISPYSFYNSNSIYPGDIAPFELSSSLEKDKIGEYYTIVTYWIGEEGAYYYEGSENVVLNGEINKIKYFDNAKYLGEIKNNTNREIYFVEVTIISRDSDGNIIDITYDSVSGTNYKYYDDYTTDTHIAPNEIAPFEINSSADYENVASFEYRINYEYSEIPSSVENDTPLLFTLVGNYPNPFNPQTTIEYILENNSNIELSVYNASGQKIVCLVNGIVQEGKHSVSWNAKGFPSGLYFYRLNINGFNESKKMLLLK